MSSDGQLSEAVFPEDVFQERNFLRRLENALGVDRGDLSADDTMQAAIAWNAALIVQAQRQQINLLSAIAGQPIPDPGPTPPDGVDPSDLRDAVIAAIEDAQYPVNRQQLYDFTTNNAGQNILSQFIEPMTDSSSFRVTISWDTSTDFAVVEDPTDGAGPFEQTLNEGSPVSADSRFEFQFDVDPDAEYNFRAPNDTVTVQTLRVQEIFDA